MSTYPAAIKSWTRLENDNDYPQAVDVNTLYSEVSVIERELGVNVAGSVNTTVVQRLNAKDNLALLNAGKLRRKYISAINPDLSNPPDIDTLTASSFVQPVMWFDPDTNEKIHGSWYIPPDCDTTKNITLFVDALVPSVSVSTVSLKLAYSCRGDDELVNSSVNVKTFNQDLSGWGVNYRRVITDLAVSQSFTAGADTVSFTFLRDSTNASDTYNNNFGVYNLSFQYTNRDPA